MIENEIYCYVNGFFKWNVIEKTSYIVGNKKFFGEICILNLRNKRKKFKVVKKRTMNLFKGSEDFGFSNFIWLD